MSLDWSPDGKYLAGGMSNGTVYLWEPHKLVRSPEPVEETTLTAQGPWYVFMAPVTWDGYLYLWAINADGTGLTKLSHEPTLRNIAVRPTASGENSTTIAFVAIPRRVSESFTLKIMTLPGGEIKASIPLGPSWYELRDAIRADGLIWSPDGSKLAFISGKMGAASDISLYDANTGTVTRITNGKDYAHPLRWSLDSRYLIYERFTHVTMGRPDGLEIWSARTDGTGEILLMREPGASFLGWRGPTEGLFERWDKQRGFRVIEAVNIETGESQTIVNEGYRHAVFTGEYNALLMALSHEPTPETPLVLIRDGERIEIPGRQIDWVGWDSALDLFVGWAGDEKYYISPLGQYIDRSQPEDFRPARLPGWIHTHSILISPDKTLWTWCYRGDGGGNQLWIGEPTAEPATKISSWMICDYPPEARVTWSPDSQSLLYLGYGGLWIARRPGFEFVQLARALPTECYGDCNYIGAWVP